MLQNKTFKKITFSKNYWSNSFIEKHKLRREVCNLVYVGYLQLSRLRNGRSIKDNIFDLSMLIG